MKYEQVYVINSANFKYSSALAQASLNCDK